MDAGKVTGLKQSIREAHACLARALELSSELADEADDAELKGGLVYAHNCLVEINDELRRVPSVSTLRKLDQATAST